MVEDIAKWNRFLLDNSMLLVELVFACAYGWEPLSLFCRRNSGLVRKEGSHAQGKIKSATTGEDSIETTTGSERKVNTDLFILMHQMKRSDNREQSFSDTSTRSVQ